MPARLLSALDSPLRADDVARLVPRLRAAVDGTGPALALLPPAPQATREALLSAASRTVPDTAALVVATSGTTGVPRLAMLSATAVTAAADAAARVLGRGTFLLALPCHTIAGLMAILRSVLAEREPVVVDSVGGFSPAAFSDGVGRLLRQDDGDGRFTSLVPTQLKRLLDAGDASTAALSALDAVLVGGAACPEPLRARALDAGVRVVTTYGMTETCGGCVYDGTPLPGVRVRADPHGRVEISGPMVFSGYLDEPGLTAATLVDGWLLTQDRGELDSAGRLTVHGRLDDVVVSGGVNVSLPAVEAALTGLPGVRQAVVLAFGDDEWGVRLTAVLEAGLESGAAAPDLRTVRSHVRAVVGAAAAPSRVVVVPTLPMLTSGKPDRLAVRSLVEADRPGDEPD
jgi:O-succinylbenzoic acid--CoA ligase